MGILCRSTLSLCAINGCCCLFSYGCLFLVSCVYRSVTFTLVLLCILFYIFYRSEFDFLTNAHFKNAGLPTTLYFLYLWFNQYNTTYFVRCCSVVRCFIYWFEFYGFQSRSHTNMQAPRLHLYAKTMYKSQIGN